MSRRPDSNRRAAVWHAGEYREEMTTISLTDGELRLLREALHAYLNDFGHNEGDILRVAKALLARLQVPTAVPA